MNHHPKKEPGRNPLARIVGSFRNADRTVNLAWVLVVWVGILLSRWWTAEEIKEITIAADIKAKKEAVRYPYTRTTSGRVVSINLIAGQNPPEYKVMVEDTSLPKEADGNIAQVELILPENSYTTRIQPGRTYEFLFETNLKSIGEIGTPPDAGGLPVAKPDGTPVSPSLQLPPPAPVPPSSEVISTPSSTPGKPILGPNDKPGQKPSAPPPATPVPPPAPAMTVKPMQVAPQETP